MELQLVYAEAIMTDILIDIIEEIVNTAEKYDIVERIVLRHVCKAFKVLLPLYLIHSPVFADNKILRTIYKKKMKLEPQEKDRGSGIHLTKRLAATGQSQVWFWVSKHGCPHNLSSLKAALGSASVDILAQVTKRYAVGTSMMDTAIEGGLEVVKWMHEEREIPPYIRPGICFWPVPNLLPAEVKAIAEYLKENYVPGFTSSSVNPVRWFEDPAMSLDDRRDFLTLALDSKYIHMDQLLQTICEAGDLELLKWVVDTKIVGDEYTKRRTFNDDTGQFAIFEGHLHIMKYLDDLGVVTEFPNPLAKEQRPYPFLDDPNCLEWFVGRFPTQSFADWVEFCIVFNRLGALQFFISKFNNLADRLEKHRFGPVAKSLPLLKYMHSVRPLCISHDNFVADALEVDAWDAVEWLLEQGLPFPAGRPLTVAWSTLASKGCVKTLKNVHRKLKALMPTEEFQPLVDDLVRTGILEAACGGYLETIRYLITLWSPSADALYSIAPEGSFVRRIRQTGNIDCANYLVTYYNAYTS